MRLVHPAPARPKPTFDTERLIAFIGAYMLAQDEAERTGETVRIAGFNSFRVSPRKDRKADE